VADQLVIAIAADPDLPRAAATSRSGLTPRDRDVRRPVVEGRSNQEIADALCISLRTEQIHVAHILTKLDIDSRTAAATRAVREGRGCRGPRGLLAQLVRASIAPARYGLAACRSSTR
jgi:DNA-binding NarL/FixJ family response regulator